MRLARRPAACWRTCPASPISRLIRGSPMAATSSFRWRTRGSPTATSGSPTSSPRSSSALTATHTNQTDPAAAADGSSIAYATDEVDFDLTLFCSRWAFASNRDPRPRATSSARCGRRPATSSRFLYRSLGTPRDLVAQPRRLSSSGLIVTPGDFGTSAYGIHGLAVFFSGCQDAGVMNGAAMARSKCGCPR